MRPILSGTLAVLLLSAAAFSSPGQASANPIHTITEGLSGPLSKLPGVFGGGQKTEAPVHLAQASDPRVSALEEQIRSLSGTVEELNFQVLQMQEQLRKMQEDNEFRFQELEQRGGTTTNGSLPPRANPHAQAQPGAPATDRTASVPATAVEDGVDPGSVEEVVIVDDGSGNPGVTVPAGTPGAPGEPPRTFGTITFDHKGNVTGGSVGGTADVPSVGSEGIVTRNSLPAPGAAASVPPAPGAIGAPTGGPARSGETVVAALPATDDPEELYRNAYEFVLSGDYGTAEAGFRDHMARFPGDSRAADVRFWLGESLLGQKKYREAAETFLAASKEYPSARKAPDMLLKLGVALVGLDQRDVACATFSEIGKRYPDVSGALKGRVKQEQALASC